MVDDKKNIPDVKKVEILQAGKDEKQIPILGMEDPTLAGKGVNFIAARVG